MEKLEIIKQVIDGNKSIQWAAEQLGKSGRTIHRYIARLKANPDDNLSHKNKGRTPSNKLDDDKIWGLYKEKYQGLNNCAICRELEKNDGIKVSEAYIRDLFKKNCEISARAHQKTKEKIKDQLEHLSNLTESQKITLEKLEAEL